MSPPRSPPRSPPKPIGRAERGELREAAREGKLAKLARLLRARRGRRCYLALEKRFNFSAAELSVVAAGYATFRSFVAVDGERDPPPAPGTRRLFSGRRLALDFPQHFEYERRPGEMELWELSENSAVSNQVSA